MIWNYTIIELSLPGKWKLKLTRLSLIGYVIKNVKTFALPILNLKKPMGDIAMELKYN